MRSIGPFTTSAGYTDAHAIKPDPSIVQVDVLIDGAVTVEISRGKHGMMEVVGEVTITQSQQIAGATGVRVKDAVAGTHQTVTLIAWQIGDPRPVPIPVGATTLTAQSTMITGQVDSAGGITAGTGFSVAHPAAGRYVITYTSPFAAAPTVVATLGPGPSTSNRVVFIQTNSASQTEIRTQDPGGALSNEPFHFLAAVTV